MKRARKEMEERNMKKKLEEMKNYEKNLKSLEQNQEFQKRLKDNESKNKTADAQGNVIIIKPPSDKLSNDFIVPHFAINQKLDESTELRERTIGSAIVVKDSEMDEARDLSQIKNSPGSAKKERPSSPSKLEKGKVFLSKRTKKDLLGNHIPSSQAVSSTQSGPIIPAGSSFEEFDPTVGVTIIEGPNKKFGGTDYLKHFKKHSKYDYFTMYNETRGTNNLRDTMENIMGSIREEENKIKKDNIILPPISSKMHASAKSDSNEARLEFNYSQGNSFKNAIENLDLLSVKEEKEMEDKFSVLDKSDIFKEHRNTKDYIHSNKMNKTGYESINKFNYSLVQNTQWGTTNTSKGRGVNATVYSKHPIKPHTNQLLQELGQKMLSKNFLPRSRLKHNITFLNNKTHSDFGNNTVRVGKNSTKFTMNDASKTFHGK